MKLGPFPMQYTKINSKWTIYLNIKLKTMKLLEDIKVNPQNPGSGEAYLNINQKQKQKKKNR